MIINKFEFFLQGSTNKKSKMQFMIISAKKKVGVDADFLINLRGVFIIKHEQPFGSLSIDLNSAYKLGIEI